MAQELTWVVEAAIAQSRSRSSWNNRIAHWERPPSDHEEGKIQRAADIACRMIDNNSTMQEIGIKVLPQGSYHNNTNVRLEADMDLRVQLPFLMVRYGEGIAPETADSALGYYETGGPTLPELSALVRSELASDARRIFGADKVEVGSKAVSVEGLDGSRADVDLVPAFHLRYVLQTSSGDFFSVDGVGIRGADGTETWNFPEQHHANGVAKRSDTKHRFKRLVRALKRLNYELHELGAINRRLPSFLVECLVYRVENGFFLYEDDDRYARLLRIVNRLKTLLADPEFVEQACEVNDIKILFRPHQAWTISDARNFVDAAQTRLLA